MSCAKFCPPQSITNFMPNAVKFPTGRVGLQIRCAQISPIAPRKYFNDREQSTPFD